MKQLFITLFALATCAISASAQLTEQQQIQKLNYVYSYIRNNYVDKELSLEPLVDEAIRATIAELDPHSNYLSREEMEWLRGRIRGEQAGIGIRYFMHNDTLVVSSIMENSPAQHADIRLNDRIIAVDNHSIVALGTDSISPLLRGAANSDVTLQIKRRNTENTIEIELKRNNYPTSTVSASYRVGDVGYVAISSFSKLTHRDLYEAYTKLGNVSSMVIDLRDNGGGAETGAVDLASLFVRKGEVIVTNEYRDHKEVIKRKSKDDIFCDIPLVIIINENSASASELFAGAIQDNDRGVIIGRTSFGKGLIQRVVDLKDGSGITLTIGRYKTPSGRFIQRPYEMGERDTYRSDKTRYMHPDSIEHDDALLFRTLKRNRPIYGGGGITPDIYIESDSVRISECVSKSTADLAFYHAIIDYWDICSPSDILSQYPTVEAFGEGYAIDEELLHIFYKEAEYSAEGLSATDIDYIRTTLLVTMARLLYGEDANHYPLGLSLDYTQQRAIEIAGDSREIEAVLGGLF